MRITRPSSPHYVSEGSVDLQVFVEGGDPERVDLYVDGNPLATLPPPHRYLLDTDPLTEGGHDIVARARVGVTEHASDALLLVVDRAAPHVIDQFPAASALYAAGEPLEVVFSEPIDPASITRESVRLVNGVGDAFVTTLGLSDDGESLTIEIVGGPISAAGSIVAQLAPTIRDRAGLTLSATDVAWTMPLWLEDTLASEIPMVGPDWIGFSVTRPVTRRSASGDVYLAVLGVRDTDTRFVLIFRRAGSAWERAFPGAGCEFPPSTGSPPWDFELDATGSPIIAMHDTSPPANAIRICRWTGDAWTELVPAYVQPYTYTAIRIALGPGDELALARSIRRDSVTLEVEAVLSRGGVWQTARRWPFGAFAITRQTADYVLARSSGTQWRFERFTDTSTSPISDVPSPPIYDGRDGTVRGFNGDEPVFRVGCTVARRLPGGWVSAAAPAGDEWQACAAVPTPSGRVLLISRINRTTRELAAYLEVPGGGGFEDLGRGATPAPPSAEMEAVLDTDGSPIVVYARYSGDNELAVLRLNLLGRLP